MDGANIVQAAALLGAAFVMAIGSIAPAIGQGLVGAKGCENMGKYPESSRDIRNAMFIVLSVIETSAIYAFMIALLLLLLKY